MRASAISSLLRTEIYTKSFWTDSAKSTLKPVRRYLKLVSGDGTSFTLESLFERGVVGKIVIFRIPLPDFLFQF